jgi:16S rRNA (guanine527-N7)-methyltransferase
MARASVPREPDLSADRAAALRITPVSRETEERLEILARLLLQWQRTTNLIAPSTIPEIWTRHIADSLQLVDLAPKAGTWVDLGSGAGFPGLVIACSLADRGRNDVEQPEMVVHLVESNAKKAAFLREAVRATGAPAQVHCRRIEEFAASFEGRADVVTARALAPLPRLLDQAAPLLKTGAVGLFPKGQDVGAELTEASKYWSMEVTLAQSRSDPAGRIVCMRALGRRGIARE